MSSDRSNDNNNPKGPLDDLFNIFFRAFQNPRPYPNSSDQNKQGRERRFEQCISRLGNDQSICHKLRQLEEEVDELRAEGEKVAARSGHNEEAAPYLDIARIMYQEMAPLAALIQDPSALEAVLASRLQEFTKGAPLENVLIDWLLEQSSAGISEWPMYLLKPEFVPGREMFADVPYAPYTLERDSMLTNSGICWRDAFEDLLRTQQGKPLIPERQRGQSIKTPYTTWAQRVYHSSFQQQKTEQDPFNILMHRLQEWALGPDPIPWKEEKSDDDELSYEYSHDAEDEHDEPSQNGSEPKTELEAYERLLSSQSSETPTSNKPSVLSTLTTTERTVAPDGSVTTKIVLKKRFADGNEETSSTVHTQRGGDVEAASNDPWKALMQSQLQSQSSTSKSDGQEKQGEKGKKNGWFWSG